MNPGEEWTFDGMMKDVARVLNWVLCTHPGANGEPVKVTKQVSDRVRFLYMELQE